MKKIKLFFVITAITIPFSCAFAQENADSTKLVEYIADSTEFWYSKLMADEPIVAIDSVAILKNEIAKIKREKDSIKTESDSAYKNLFSRKLETGKGASVSLKTKAVPKKNEPIKGKGSVKTTVSLYTMTVDGIWIPSSGENIPMPTKGVIDTISTPGKALIRESDFQSGLFNEELKKLRSRHTPERVKK